VNDPNKIALVVMTADQHVYPVERILAASHAEDLAIIKIDAQDMAALPLVITLQSAPVGSDVSVISHPAGRFYCYTSGVVSRHVAVRSGNRDVDRLLITADVARGSSGAPVLNDRGQVVAIVKGTNSVYYSVKDGERKNLQMVFKTCIPSQSLAKLIDG
jgi:S1-C subfamily serine protease